MSDRIYQLFSQLLVGQSTHICFMGKPLCSLATRGQCCVAHESQTAGAPKVPTSLQKDQSSVHTGGSSREGAPDVELGTTHAYSKINFTVFIGPIYCL